MYRIIHQRDGINIVVGTADTREAAIEFIKDYQGLSYISLIWFEKV